MSPPARRCGIVAFAVSQAPVRFVSIMFRHMSSSSSSAGAIWAKMPAFAATMSRRPKRSTPASTAACNDARSRTSAFDATICPPTASTAATVAARSSSVARPYGAPGTSSRRSMPMMAAPSSARRTAWLRP